MAHSAHAEQRHRRHFDPSVPATLLGAPGLPFPGRRKRLAARGKQTDFRLPQTNRPLNAIVTSIHQTIWKLSGMLSSGSPKPLTPVIPQGLIDKTDALHKLIAGLSPAL